MEPRPSSAETGSAPQIHFNSLLRSLPRRGSLSLSLDKVAHIIAEKKGPGAAFLCWEASCPLCSTRKLNVVGSHTRTWERAGGRTLWTTANKKLPWNELSEMRIGLPARRLQSTRSPKSRSKATCTRSQFQLVFFTTQIQNIPIACLKYALYRIWTIFLWMDFLLNASQWNQLISVCVVSKCMLRQIYALAYCAKLQSHIFVFAYNLLT